MLFSVPQFIDVEDKIAGPLTWKQLLWMIAMGATLLVMLNIFDTSLMIVLSIPVVLLFVALAFYKPGGFPMTSFIGNAVLFLFRPKVAMWERPVAPLISSKAPAPIVKGPESRSQGDKQLTHDKLAELAKIIDSRGGV